MNIETVNATVEKLEALKYQIREHSNMISIYNAAIGKIIKGMDGGSNTIMVKFNHDDKPYTELLYMVGIEMKATDAVSYLEEQRTKAEALLNICLSSTK